MKSTLINAIENSIGICAHAASARAETPNKQNHSGDPSTLGPVSLPVPCSPAPSPHQRPRIRCHAVCHALWGGARGGAVTPLCEKVYNRGRVLGFVEGQSALLGGGVVCLTLLGGGVVILDEGQKLLDLWKRVEWGRERWNQRWRCTCTQNERARG